MTIRLPISLTGDQARFARAVQQHIETLTAHMMGGPGVPAPHASDVVEAVIARQPQDGPVATRGPDKFIALPYEIYDDSQHSPETAKAIEVLRETIQS